MTYPDDDKLIDLDNYNDNFTKNCNIDNDGDRQLHCDDETITEALRNDKIDTMSDLENPSIDNDGDHQLYCDDDTITQALRNDNTISDLENPSMMKINPITLKRFTTTPISSSSSDDTTRCEATTSLREDLMNNNFQCDQHNIAKLSHSSHSTHSDTFTTNNNTSHDDHVKLILSNNNRKLILQYIVFVLWILCFILLLSIFILVTMTYRKLNINENDVINDVKVSDSDNFNNAPTISPSLVLSQPTVATTYSTNNTINNNNINSSSSNNISISTNITNNNNNSSSNSSTKYNMSSCPVYPNPPRLKGKKGAGRTLRTIGRPGSWIENLPGVIDIQPYWNYNWDTLRIDAQPYNIEFIPMMWGGSETIKFDIQDHVLPYIENGIVQRVMGFNEPDAESQSNVTVTRALELWTLLESLNVPLVSPSCWQPKGEWMKEFMIRAKKLCRRIDYIGVHWYGGVSFEAFKSEMEVIYNMYGNIPLMITEFAPADWKATNVTMNQYSKKDVLQFMKLAIPWLEQQDWIHGYAWFSFAFNDPVGAPSSLFTEDGQLTKCGQYYASISNENIYGNQSLTVWENE